MNNIFTIIDGEVIEFSVKKNKFMPGMFVLIKVIPDENGYQSIFPISAEALERNRFESIKKEEDGYYGIDNLIYYNSRKEAEEVLALQKQFAKE